MKNLSKRFLFLLAFMTVAGMISSCRKSQDYMMDNQDFVTRASSSNMFEIAAGNLAVRTSTNTDVKAFGNHMVSDHGQAATEMSTLASQKGLTVPTTMLQQDQANLNTLATLKGSAFDKQFAAMMVVSHQQTISLFQTAASDGGLPDEDLRGFASGKLPTLQEHLQEAQALQAKVGQ